MRYYKTIAEVPREQQARLVELARERMHRGDYSTALQSSNGSTIGDADAILRHLEWSAPSIDCGMSSTCDELDLWTPEIKARRPKVKPIPLAN